MADAERSRSAVDPSAIRPIVPEDMPALRAVIEATDLFPSAMLNDMTADFFAGGSEDLWLTLGDDGGPVALAYAAPERMTLGTWNLLLIAVRPNRQGRGIGSALVRHVEQALAAAGERILLAETSGAPSFARTQAFYRTIGYVEEARIREFYKAGEDKIIFRKALGAASPSHPVIEPGCLDLRPRPPYQLLGQEAKGGNMPRSDSGEVPAVEGNNEVGLEPLGEHHDRGVGAAEREIAVRSHQLRHPRPILAVRRLHLEVGHAGQKIGFDRWTEARRHKVGRLGNHHSRHKEPQSSTLKDLATAPMFWIVRVRDSVQDACVHDGRADAQSGRSRPTIDSSGEEW